MATAPSAFFGQYASPTELGFLLSNIPKGTDFETVVVVSGPGPTSFGKSGGSESVFEGSKKDEIFYTDGVQIKGGKGYDIVVQSEKNGILSDLKLDKSTEGGVLTGTDDARIFGNKGNNNLVGNDGDNLLKGGSGKDVLLGDDGDDKLVGGSGKDTLSGGEGDDALNGGGSNDRLFGLAGDDKLFGAGGKDTLIGGIGNDTLFGGHGADKLTGNEGSDVFGFLKGEKGLDVINDFEAGVDKIDLSAFNTDFDKLKFKDNGDDVVVTVGQGKNAAKFKLLGYNSSDIDGSFFQF